ncbi:nucleotide exchange factor GrpE [Flavobacterium gelidilacus]|jgi:molecular chaperone GrpE
MNLVICDNLTLNKKWQYICYITSKAKMFKKIFKNMNQESAENIEKDEVNAETLSENQEEQQPELSIEEQLQEDLAKEKDKFLRLFAEYDNFKKRTAKERIDLFKSANQEVLQSMLPVLDDFDRAMIEITKSEDETLIKGVELIHEKLKSTLVSKGLEIVELKAGDVFDADFAEAITQIPSPNMKGKIVDVIEKGYKLGDKIIRFPKVVIGQ